MLKLKQVKYFIKEVLGMYVEFFWIVVWLIKLLIRLSIFLTKFFYRFSRNRVRNFFIFLGCLWDVLPYFRYRNGVTEYTMVSLNKDYKRQKRRFKVLHHLLVLCLFGSISIFFFDMAEDDQFLYLYEFHKWW